MLTAATVTAAPHFSVGSRADPGPHPRSLLGPEHVGVVRERLSREPYRTLFARVWSWARRQYSTTDSGISAQQRRANTARAAAYAYLLDRKLDHRGRPVPFADAAERRGHGTQGGDLPAGP